MVKTVSNSETRKEDAEVLVTVEAEADKMAEPTGRNKMAAPRTSVSAAMSLYEHNKHTADENFLHTVTQHV